MIVVDTNIVAFFLIEGDKTGLVRKLWEIDPDWRLPRLWQHEFLNVLATYARSGGMPAQEVRKIWQTAQNLFREMEYEVDMIAALELAIKHKISAYDAQFVVLARSLHTALVTEDRRLARRFPKLVNSIAGSIQ